LGRVEGKWVVVTGGGRGQGAAEAASLVREGATVVALDLADGAPELTASLGELAPRLTYRRLDVSRPEEWSEFGAWLREQFPRVDGLVNNAGMSFRARLTEVAVEDWERVLAVNCTGALLGIQTVAPLLRGGGSIVNVGSVAALSGHYAVAYTVSKWALRGLSRVASLELGPLGVRVNTIHPGFIETPMTASAPAAFRDANLDSTPLGRTGTVDDVAPLVVYLISDESGFLSGADIPVDGGMTGHGGAKLMSDAVRHGLPHP
jgi:3alpha(or 20beta)-hydroxysteroid dehydrogenase